MRFFFVLLSIFLFSSCAKKDDLSINSSELKRQTLMFSKKKKITQNGENALITASYVSSVLNDKSERFILSITPNSFDIQNLKAFINDENANLEPLNSQNELINLVFANEHTNFYELFLSKNFEQNEIKLTICLNLLPCFDLYYEKYPKSLRYRLEDFGR